MTYDQLYKKVEGLWHDSFKSESWTIIWNIVKLHKAIDNPNFPESDPWCWQCAEGRGYAKWPCSTIQAIIKELK